ncbi:MAG: cyclic nucleotide-binding domain-containing protein [Betaproteobacteria bacterium]|nr:cyclic nucleotide-binding domain-containing protein [Betaproteobacteria bacterium]
MKWTKENLDFDETQRLLNKLAEQVKAFHTLTTAEIAELLASAEKCTYAQDTVIVKEGSVGDYMYIIFEGEALVTKQSHHGDTELAHLGAADSFGEMSLADHEARSATVKTLTPCVLVRLSEPTLFGNPALAMKIYRNIAKLLSERLRSTDDLLAWRL